MSSITLKRVSLDLIDANPDNARRGVGDIKDLTESIRQVGIVQPPICRNGQGEGADRYELIAGHRRTAAARLAGLTEIDILVREGDDESARQVAQLVENLQRKDLDPVEEATGFMRAVGLGMTQKDLAKAVGRSVGHVGLRLRILELPAKVLAEIKKGTLPVLHAEPLLELDDPALQIQIAQEAVARQFTQRIEQTVGQAIAQMAAKVELHQKQEAYKAKGITVIDERPAYDSKSMKRIAQDIFFEGVSNQVKSHVNEPCHVVFLATSYGRIEEIAYCSDSKRHTKAGKSELKTKVGGTMDPLERAKRAHERDTQASAKAFLGSHLRKLPSNAEMIETLADSVIAREVRQHSERGLCEIFGIEPLIREEKQGDKVVRRKDHGTPLRQFMGESKNKLKVAYAVTFMGVQNNVSDIASLINAGYTPPEAPVKGESAPVEQAEQRTEAEDDIDDDAGDDVRYEGFGDG